MTGSRSCVTLGRLPDLRRRCAGSDGRGLPRRRPDPRCRRSRTRVPPSSRQPAAPAAVRAATSRHPRVAGGDRSVRQAELLRGRPEGRARLGKWAGSRSTLVLHRHHEGHALTCLPPRPADAARQRVRVHPAGRRGGVRARRSAEAAARRRSSPGPTWPWSSVRPTTSGPVARDS